LSSFSDISAMIPLPVRVARPRPHLFRRVGETSHRRIGRIAVTHTGQHDSLDSILHQETIGSQPKLAGYRI
jgi:hypothetical protein